MGDLIGRPCCQADEVSDGGNGFSHVDSESCSAAANARGELIYPVNIS